MTRTSNLSAVILWLIVPVVLINCQLKGMEFMDPDPKEITTRDLYRTLRDHGTLLVVYGFKDQSLKKELTSDAQTLSYGSTTIKIELRASDEVTEAELASRPVLLIGNPDFNPWIEYYANKLPYVYNQGDFKIGPYSFDARNHVLKLNVYPNPENARIPISLLASADEPQLRRHIRQRISTIRWGGWSYEIVQGSRRLLLGNFSQHPSTRWQYDHEDVIVLPKQVLHQWQQGPYHYFSFHESLAKDSVSSLMQNSQQATQEIEDFFNTKFQPGLIKRYLYPSTEVKGLMMGHTTQNQLSFEDMRVDQVYNQDFINRPKGFEHQLLIRKVLGMPAHPVWEQGLALYFTDSWEGQGYGYWAKRLIESGNALSVPQLLDEGQAQYFSKLKRESLSGSLVAFLLQKWGKEQFIERYAHWLPNQKQAEELTKEWWDWVVQLPHTSMSDISGNSDPSRDQEFLKGVNFTHEGYRIYNGYGSQKSTQSLQHLAHIQANTIAIVPYTGMRDPNQAQPLHFSNGAGGENDEGVVHTIKRAQALGMTTMLKPQVWIRGSWPGDVNMKNDQQWDEFFEYYYQWISHYALMAEMHDVDFFCIGVEFSEAALLKPDYWRRLIKRVRGIYSGKLVYAANWGNEFEQIEFWDQLDVIGLNCYYPLAKENATSNTLRKGMTEVFELIKATSEKNQKPVILTEIGFRSVDAPWVQPHEEAGEKSYNPQHQAQAYQAVFDQLPNYPEVVGILWWKWPTIMENRPQDRRFVPSGKLAEQVMKSNFEQNVKR